MTPEEIYEYFKANPIPDGFMLNKATKIADPKLFLENTLIAIKAWKGNVEKCPDWWRLQEVYRLVTER